MKRILVFATCLLLLIVALPATQIQADETWPPEGYVVVDDMILPEDYVTGRASINVELWPSTIAYTFDANVDATNQSRAIAAMAEIEAVANIDFIPRTNQPDYIKFLDDDVNSSFVGMQGEEQIIRIVSWTSRYIIVHEIMHALGFFHEQSRPDRDFFVRIYEDNIKQDKKHNFNIHQDAHVYPVRAYGLPGAETYDFDSVMHYGKCDFLKDDLNCPSTGAAGDLTIAPLAAYWPDWLDNIGQRNHMSKLDKLTLSFLYPEDNWAFVDKHSTEATRGTFVEPYESMFQASLFAPAGSTVFIQPGTYNEGFALTFDRPMTLVAPLGNVTIDR